MKMIIEKETHKLDYLDIAVISQQNYFIFDIFRKPTTTDLIIHYFLSLKRTHKSGINYPTDSMNTYHLANDKKRKNHK